MTRPRRPPPTPGGDTNANPQIGERLALMPWHHRAVWRPPAVRPRSRPPCIRVPREWHARRVCLLRLVCGAQSASAPPRPRPRQFS